MALLLSDSALCGDNMKNSMTPLSAKFMSAVLPSHWGSAVTGKNFSSFQIYRILLQISMSSLPSFASSTVSFEPSLQRLHP